MGKASDVFRSKGSGLPIGRLAFMAILLVLVLIALLATRSGLFGPPDKEGGQSPSAPSGPSATSSGPSGNAIGARARADNDAVGLDLRGTHNISPPADNQASADNGSFAAVRDGTGVTYAERDAYYGMVRKAWGLRNAASADVPLVGRNALLESPGSWRGKVVRIRGSLVRLRPATYDPDPEQPGRPTLYYECILKLVGEDISVVHVFENPFDHDINPGGGVVYADAYFYKVWGYNDDQLEAPLLLGFRLVKEKADTTLALTGVILLGGFLLIVVVLWLVLRRGGREAERMRDRLKQVPVDEVYIPEPRALPRDKYYEERERQQKPPEPK